jgi:hypothetical protein
MQQMLQLLQAGRNTDRLKFGPVANASVPFRRVRPVGNSRLNQQLRQRLIVEIRSFPVNRHFLTLGG